MDYLAAKDLKKTKKLWEKLASERKLVITRDGKPSALMISVSPETVEESLREIRRALFSAAISRCGNGPRWREAPPMRRLQQRLTRAGKNAAFVACADTARAHPRSNRLTSGRLEIVCLGGYTHW